MKRLSVRYAAVTLFLILLVGATYAVEVWQVDRIEARGGAAQAEAVAQAARTVEQRIRQIEADLLQRAEDLAELPLVRRALQGDSTAHADVVRLFSELHLPARMTAELYTPTPELVAWQGPSLPLGAATRTTRFLAAPQTAVADDGVLRQALVAWLPVREGRRVLGAVRVFQLVRTRVPVRNQYLRDFDIVERWQVETGLPLDVQFGPTDAPPEDVPVHEIRSEEGLVLARVVVPTPSLEALKADVRKTASDVMAFWLVLLLGWGVAGLWMVHEHERRRAFRAAEGRWPWGRAVGSFVGLAAAWGGLRYALLALDVPSRWVERLSGLDGEVPLFDPVYLASGVGGGLIGSAGELIVTAVFAVVFGLVWFRFAFGVLLHVRSAERGQLTDRAASRPDARWALGAVLGAGAGTVVLAAVAFLIRRATLDATLPYFDRTEPLPQSLVMLVFGAFLLLTLAALLTLAGLGMLVRVKGWARVAAGAGVVALLLAVTYATTPIGQSLPWLVAVAFFAVGGGVAWWMEQGPQAWTEPLMLRRVLLGVLVVTALAYPITYSAAQDEREARIEDAAEEFAEGEDARVAFALEGVLLDARASDAVEEALRRRFGQATPSERAASFDSLATDLVTGSLLAALADYTIGLALLGPAGDTLGYYRETPLPDQDAPPFARGAGEDRLSFGSLRRRYAADTAPGFVVEREAALEGRGRYRYAGVGPIRRASDGAILGWVTAQAEPKPARYVSETPFPRVLVPAGLSNVVESDLAFAEFRDGVLVRTRGDDYGRFRLPEEVTAVLRTQPQVWRTERFGREQARVYYRRFEEDGRWRVVSVRAPAVIVYDHLYFYVRMLLPALALGLVAYLLGVWMRRQAGLLLHRRRLRDRVLNRFLLVGVVSVLLTGLIGQQVVVTQNRQAVQERLKLRLARVEAALYEEATPEGGSLPLYQLIDRARPDIVGPRLGLDVNLYRGADLVASSRSQLVRQQLLDRRLDSDVYEQLFVEGERYAFAEERIGTFTYTTGYEALPDDSGRPGAVIAVPTLPEQTAIEADQARMIAYLFGVLLVLLVGIFLITTLLANRLTRPFRRLREGLLAVGAGEGSEPIPVESADEVGELIETFNAMQHQLDESRRKLAQQERELAWREMARQVAHEIKNPLTPMKLSVQHLRRAHREGGGEAGGDGEAGRFASLLDRITGTLIEQIDALTRIANEFSSFARLPSRHLERLDLNAVVREAAALIGEEEHARLVLTLADEPLPVVADREELRRVYINLFKNALQAMPEDERGTVTVRTERRPARSDAERGWAVSAVRDTGTGIPDEVRDKVFQPNFSTKTSGMGLGLAITKKAVEDVGGEIDFETEVGVGTTFHVRLPLAPAELTAPTEATGDGRP
jgi:two-component system nitrogen regulation sensor histidine kinase NtrY